MYFWPYRFYMFYDIFSVAFMGLTGQNVPPAGIPYYWIRL